MIQYVVVNGKPWARDSSRGSGAARVARAAEDKRAELEMRDHFEPVIPDPKTPEEFWVESLRA